MLEHARAFLSRRSSMPRPSLEHASASDGACLGHPLSCSSIPPVARAFLGHARACSSISLPSLEHSSAMLEHFSPVARACLGHARCSSISHEPSTHYFTSLVLPPPWFLTFYEEQSYSNKFSSTENFWSPENFPAGGRRSSAAGGGSPAVGRDLSGQPGHNPSLGP